MFTMQQSSRILRGIFFLLVLLASGFFLLFLQERKSFIPSYESTSWEATKRQPISSLEGPSFYLHRETPKFEMVDLAKALKTSVLPIRPGTYKEEFCLRLSVTPRGKPQEVLPGQKIYLGLDREKKLCFSQEKTSFWITPKKITPEKVFFAVGIDVENFEEASLQNKEVSIKPKASTPLKILDVKKEGACPEFSQISWLVPDALQGFLFPEKAKKHRLFIDGRAIEVQKGDVIVKGSNGWELSKQPLEGMPPMLRVVSLEEDKAFFEGWNGSEWGGVRFIVPKQASVPLTVTNNNLIKNVRLKTRLQVQCEIENQPLEMKVGDWILKRQGVWKPLNTQEAIRQYLEGEIEGVLFVFQNIGKVKGEKCVQGYLFDTPRTQSLYLEASIQRQKAKPTSLKPAPHSLPPKGQNR